MTPNAHLQPFARSRLKSTPRSAPESCWRRCREQRREDGRKIIRSTMDRISQRPFERSELSPARPSVGKPRPAYPRRKLTAFSLLPGYPLRHPEHGRAGNPVRSSHSSCCPDTRCDDLRIRVPPTGWSRSHSSCCPDTRCDIFEGNTQPLVGVSFSLLPGYPLRRSW